MEVKKKRGSNYTNSEKDILLELVKQHHHIIENKETNSSMIQKKREKWASIAHQYNAVASSGCRTWEQLRHLYENIKQRSKRNIAHANRLEFYEKTKIPATELLKAKDVKEVQTKASLDKVARDVSYRTGGGSYRSTISDHDALILSMVAPQVQPLANPYDDAALYFGDTDKNNIVEPCPDITYGTVCVDDEANNNIIIVEDDPSTMLSNSGDREITITSPKPKLSKSASKPAGQPKRNTDYKNQYFKIKAQNAKIERKSLINNNKMAINKYKLEMEILKLRLMRLKKKD